MLLTNMQAGLKNSEAKTATQIQLPQWHEGKSCKLLAMKCKTGFVKYRKHLVVQAKS